MDSVESLLLSAILPALIGIQAVFSGLSETFQQSQNMVTKRISYLIFGKIFTPYDDLLTYWKLRLY